MARRRSQKQRKQQARSGLPSGPILLGLAVVAAIAVAVILIVLNRPGDKSIDRPEGTYAEGRTLGEPDAPVTIIEYADYQCPFCMRFTREAGLQIDEEYVQTGLVKIEFRNMAIIGEESLLAAEAAECANEQDRFWDYHDKLFEEQRGENDGTFALDRLKRFAGQIDLDQAAFDACMDGTEHEQLILDEREAARDAGVESTPWFFVVVSDETSGEEVIGNKDFEEFQAAINKKLEEAGVETPTPASEEDQ